MGRREDAAYLWDLTTEQKAMCEEVGTIMATDNGGQQTDWSTRARICLRSIVPQVRGQILAWWALLSDYEKFATCAGQHSTRLAIPLQASQWLEDVFDGN